MEDAEIGLISYGSTSRSCRAAVRAAREKGIKVGLLRLQTIWPFADIEIRRYSGRIKQWIVAEMNLGQVAHEVEWAVAGQVPVDRINRIDGEPIPPPQIIAKIEEYVHV